MKDFNDHRNAAKAGHKAKLGKYAAGGAAIDTSSDSASTLLNDGTVSSGSGGGLSSNFAMGQPHQLSSAGDFGPNVHQLSSASDFGPNVHILSSPSDFGVASTTPSGTAGAKSGGRISGTMRHAMNKKDHK